MAKLIIDGLTPEQALTLSDWLEGAGEQDCQVWFEAREIPSPLVDVKPKNWRKVDKKTGDVTICCYTPKQS